MVFIFDIVLTIVLVKLLVDMENPRLCAGLYGAGVFVLALVFGAGAGSFLIGTVMFFYAWGWFYLLFQVSGFLWLVVLVGGILLKAMAPFLIGTIMEMIH